MDNRLPKFVEFHEEGPREGFQIEKRRFPLEGRVRFINALSKTGLKRIQVASFVNPKAVPSMSDAEELFKAITRREGVRYTGVWLNKRGFERIAALPGAYLYGKIVLYTTDAFSLMNNNCTAAQMRRKQIEMLKAYDACGLPLQEAYILTAFGCNLSGHVPLSTVMDCVKFIVDICRNQNRPLPHIFLADTVGWANPEGLKRQIESVRGATPGARIGLHLHDTRGLGAANFYAALEMGIDLFDSSVAGLGGCPFAAFKDNRAAGNICTEDMVFMCEELGIQTGIDLQKMIAAARLAEKIIGRPLPGKIMHSGLPSILRKAC
ncbi:MAG: hydroxymethylglutaryl-CoA lyase [Proteobacteria bacterium]|nr:hydroxymethylglutaryl-CoA lyase [Pseudomonadota bacterium]